MGRGRPLKYQTEEAKIEANRAKSKRSYNKRKDNINRRKCERHRDLDPELALRKPLPPLIPRSKKEKGETPPAKFWIKLAEKIPGRFQELIGERSVPQFLTYIAQDFEAQYRNSEPEEQCRANMEHCINEIGQLQTKLCRYFDRLLNIVGLGQETSRVNEIAADMRRVELSLQDLLADVLVDGDAVARQIRHGRLTFA